MSDLLRIYGEHECAHDSDYPLAWNPGVFLSGGDVRVRIPDFVREQAGHRCERCGHPYPPGIAERYPRGEWTPCDNFCRHDGPWRTAAPDTVPSMTLPASAEDARRLGADGWYIWAQWRILTVHHLNGVKYDCRWWNLAALCQRCHLTIQGKVRMEQRWVKPHTAWFKPHAAGWYASTYLGEELTREEALARQDELLALDLEQPYLDGLEAWHG